MARLEAMRPARESTRAASPGPESSPAEQEPSEDTPPSPAPPPDPSDPFGGRLYRRYEEFEESQRQFLDRLGPEQRERLGALGHDQQLGHLEPHVRRFDPITAGESIRRLTPRLETPSVPIPETTEGLILALAGGPSHWPQALAEWLARDFGSAKDRELWRAFEQLAHAVRAGTFPAEHVADAYRQGMGPKARNRGAVFNRALKRHGWGS